MTDAIEAALLAARAEGEASMRETLERDRTAVALGVYSIQKAPSPAPEC